MDVSHLNKAPLALTFALHEEIKPILKECQIMSRISEEAASVICARLRGIPLIFCQTGIGMVNAHKAVQFLLGHHRPSLILSAGCAGATRPDLKTGDVVIPSKILGETAAGFFETDAKARERLEGLMRQNQIPYHKGPLLTTLRVANCEDKKRRGEQGVSVIDMETAAIAALSEKHKIPFLSLRVVFDPLEEELPFTEPMTDEIHPLSFLLKNPGFILKIPKYFWMNRLCQRRLYKILVLLLEQPAEKIGQ